jgi:hypothetical protein
VLSDEERGALAAHLRTPSSVHALQPTGVMNAPKRRHPPRAGAHPRRAHEPKHPRRAAPSAVPAPEPAERGARLHGDSYSEVGRDADLIGATSTHEPRVDRRAEEPSEAATRADESPEPSSDASLRSEDLA